MLGALMFMLTKARGYVDSDDSLLGYFMFVGFALWLAGLSTLYLRYGPQAGRLGKTGLGMSVMGIALLAVGHLFTFMPFGEEIAFVLIGTDLFMLVALGALALMFGAVLFGIPVLQREVLPGCWRFLPLVTGLTGFVWVFFTNSEENRFPFMLLRTLFVLGWVLMGYVLLSDRTRMAEASSEINVGAAKIR